MGLESLVHLLVVMLVVGMFAFVIHWVIAHYLPEPARTPAFFIAGAILLIVLLVLFLRWAGVAGLKV